MRPKHCTFIIQNSKRVVSESNWTLICKNLTLSCIQIKPCWRVGLTYRLMITSHPLLPHASCFSWHFLFITFTSPADPSIWLTCWSFCRYCVLGYIHISHHIHISVPLWAEMNLKVEQSISKSNLDQQSKKLKSVIIWKTANFTRHLPLKDLRWTSMHTALWIMPECGGLIAWALIITLMIR